jgi:acyl-CoA thioesterase-1
MQKMAKASLFGILSHQLFSVLVLLLFMLCCLSCEADKSKTNKPNMEEKELAKKEEEKTKSDKKVVLFYGDSLTAGYGLEDDQSFPSHIEDKIDSLALNYTVVNAGLSGETTSGGLQRLDWVMKQKVDIFFLELGANDMLRGLPLEETRKNLSEIITKVKAKNANIKIALCEMIAAPNMGDEYVKAFNQIFKDLAKEHNITFVPFFLDGVAGHPDLLLRDGKHPNAKGQVIAADNIWKILEGML